MIYGLIIFTVGFVGVVFYLAKVVVLGLEQKADEDVMAAKDVYTKIIEQKEKAQAEEDKLQKQAAQIFTLYEMTKEITRHFDEKAVFDIFCRQLKENVEVTDCRLLHDLEDGFKDGKLPADYGMFVLRAKEKRLGILVYKDLAEKDKEKFAILSHQFVLALRRLRLYKDIETLAITDGLTGVYTRRHFLERFHEEIRRAYLHQTKIAFLMIDADHFKMINDQYGHLTGDAALKDIACIIQQGVREIDIVGRFGGEEFCVMLPDTDSQGALVVAERIRKAAQDRVIKAYDNTLHITLSIGMAIFPADGKQAEELMDKADWALYRAKAQGRNGVVVFGSYKP